MLLAESRLRDLRWTQIPVLGVPSVVPDVVAEPGALLRYGAGRAGPSRG